jgi:hypothetical protein
MRLLASTEAKQSHLSTMTSTGTTYSPHWISSPVEECSVGYPLISDSSRLQPWTAHGLVAHSRFGVSQPPRLYWQSQQMSHLYVGGTF